MCLQVKIRDDNYGQNVQLKKIYKCLLYCIKLLFKITMIIFINLKIFNLNRIFYQKFIKNGIYISGFSPTIPSIRRLFLPGPLTTILGLFNLIPRGLASRTPRRKLRHLEPQLLPFSAPANSAAAFGDGAVLGLIVARKLRHS